ncbi:hypothetical protein D3C79_805520 [compost metagenome]
MHCHELDGVEVIFLGVLSAEGQLRDNIFQHRTCFQRPGYVIQNSVDVLLSACPCLILFLLCESFFLPGLHVQCFEGRGHEGVPE